MNLGAVTDDQLRYYINEIFSRYDRDFSGGLDVAQLALFFTDLYRSLGYNVVITLPLAQQALREIDTNFDGRASREEIYYAFRLILAQQNKYVQNVSVIPNYQSNYQAYSQPVYAQQVVYGQQPVYNPQPVYGQPIVYSQQPVYPQQQQIYPQQQQIYPQQQQGYNRYPQQVQYPPGYYR